MTEADAILILALMSGAVGLTFAMFHSKNAMLGFPSAILWALLGGWSYGLSSVAWDFYHIFALACLLGMSTFCMLGAYGLREKHDSIGDRELEKGDGKLIGDERQEPDIFADDITSEPSERTKALRSRAKARRRWL